MPLWIASGLIAALRGAAGDVTEGAVGHTALPAYARFPQGLPPGWPPPDARPRRCRPAPTDGLREAAPAPAGPLPGSERS